MSASSPEQCDEHGRAGQLRAAAGVEGKAKLKRRKAEANEAAGDEPAADCDGGKEGKTKKRQRDAAPGPAEEEEGEAAGERTPPKKHKRRKDKRQGKSEAADSGDEDSEEANGDGSGTTADVHLPYTVELGNKRRLTVDKFQGRTMVNVREFYQDAAGELKPTKKGVALSAAQWRILSDNAAAVDKLIDKYE